MKLVLALCAAFAFAQPTLRLKVSDTATCEMTSTDGNTLTSSCNLAQTGCTAGSTSMCDLLSRVAQLEADVAILKTPPTTTVDPLTALEAQVAALNPYVWYKSDSLTSSGNSWTDSGSCGCNLVPKQSGSFPTVGIVDLNGSPTKVAHFDGSSHCIGTSSFHAPQNEALSMFGLFKTHQSPQWGYPWGLGDHVTGGQLNNVMAMEIEGANAFDIAYGHGRDEKFGGLSQSLFDNTDYEVWTTKGSGRNSMQVMRNHVQLSQTSNTISSNGLPNRSRMSLGCLDFALTHPRQSTKVDWVEFIYFKQDLNAAQTQVVNDYLSAKFGR